MTHASTVPEIRPEDLKARMDAGDVPLLVDVRELYEAQIADLPEVGQARIPTGEFAQRCSELDPEREIVVYCRSGSRSAWAAQILLDRGYEHVLNLEGGILGWRAEVDPSITAY